MKRIVSLVLVALLLFGAVSPAAMAADPDTVYIRNVSDLMDLAEQCVLDTWSVHKTVSLTCDLDLSGMEFNGIPLFDGHFDGNGHTVQGLAMEQDASTAGLFRQILSNGVVENINVSGTVTPGGTASMIGGIAGENNGTIRNCTVTGTVRGSRCVGGITGSNGESGVIDQCETWGVVSGEHRVGGTAGENLGLIRACENHAEINTDITGGAALEEVDLSLPAEELADVTDVGGIAGYSPGAVMECGNWGPVGYLRVGYNIGGIVGRQSGYTGACENHGEVLGRKDVGGVTGQLDPDTKWNFSSEKIHELQDMLDELQARIDTLVGDVETKQGLVSADISAMLGAADRTGYAAEGLAEEAVDWVNGNLETVNELSGRISFALSGLETVSRDLIAFTDNLPEVAAKLSDAARTLGDAVDASAPGLDGLASAFDISEDTLTELQDAATSLQTGIDQLLHGLDDPSEMDAGLQTVSSGFSGLSDGFGEIAGRLRAEGLTDLAGNFEVMDSALDEIAEAAPGSAGETDVQTLYSFMMDTAVIFEEIDTALDGIDNSIEALRINATGMEIPAPTTGAEQIQSTPVEAPADVVQDPPAETPEVAPEDPPEQTEEDTLEDTLEEPPEAVPEDSPEPPEQAPEDALEEAPQEAADNVPEPVDTGPDAAALASEGIELAEDAIGLVEDAFSFLHRAAEDAGALLDDLGNRPALSFSFLDADHSSGTELFASLHAVNVALDTLAAQFQDTELLGDLQRISNQLFAVLEFLVGQLDQSDRTVRERIEDISAGDTAQYTGTVYQCVNQADVTAETNVGGIAGAVTLEISFDQEDEWNLSALISDSAKYVIFAALRDCQSASAVTARKTAAGGIVGRMDYGAALNCEACGEVAASGNYAGGVAGYSMGTLQECRARSNLSAGNYLGGIAGYGHHVYDCLAMPNITGRAEFEGSIAGDADGTVSGNFYAESTVGGVNGFSFAGQAQAADYEDLLGRAPDPELFQTITVTFLAEGDTVDAVTIPFGGSVELLPEVPDKDGRYWKWDSFDNRAIYRSLTVEGAYYSPIPVLSTGEEIPAFLVEGTFYEGQRLTAAPISVDVSSLGLQPEEVLAAYTLSVDDYADTLTVRMRQEADGRLYRMDADGAFIGTDFTRDGSYIVFSLDNGGGFVYAAQEQHTRPWVIILGIAGAAVLAAGIIVLVRKKKRRSKAESASPT